jgi:hypothetical protein
MKNLLVFSLITGILALLLTLVIPPAYISPALPFLFFFFIAATLLSARVIFKAIDSRFIRFVNIFLLTIILKLAVYAAVMIIYVLLNRTDAIPFMLGFFILYLLYTIFETTYIVGKTGRNTPDLSPKQ